MQKRSSLLNGFTTFILLITLVGSACNFLTRVAERPIPPPSPTEAQPQPPTPETPTELAPTEQPTEPPPVSYKPDPRLVFATFEEPEAQVGAGPSPFSAPPEMAEVYNPFVLSPALLERLQKDGFFVAPGMEKEFFMLYEKARYANIPIFVTSDSLSHSYHLLFDKVLRTVEVKHFIPLLADLNVDV